MRAEGTPPRAVPTARPERLAPDTKLPAAVDEVWVPWPSVSLGERISAPARGSLRKNRAPIILLHKISTTISRLNFTSPNKKRILDNSWKKKKLS